MVDPRGKGRALAGAWFLLALLALAGSTLFAVLLVAGRAPLPTALAAAQGHFRSALVLHVCLAVVAWFLCCAAGVWTLAARAQARWLWAAPLLALIGIGAMCAALFDPHALPVLANYVPVLDSWLFNGGLALLLLAVLACAVHALLALAPQLAGSAPWRYGAFYSLLAALVAALVLALALGQGALARGVESLVWGAGHVLQFVHILLLMSIWSVLGQAYVGRRAVLWLLAGAAAPLLAALFISVNWPLEAPGYRLAFTNLMRWASWPGAGALALLLLWRLARAGRATLAAELPLALSAALFVLGCVVGFLIRADSTMVPAHYHGTVGAVTLGYMALAYRLRPQFGAAPARRAHAQLALYGAGLATLVLALAWSGALGTPRKTVHAAPSLAALAADPSYTAAMAAAGLGGLLAIVGAAWFVASMAGAASARLRALVGPRRLAGASAGLAALLAVLVALATLLPSAPPHALDPQAQHGAQQSAELARQFADGVKLLSARRYSEAVSAWHDVLALAPRLPEAHVNMGYALIGVGQLAAARDFFSSAIELNPNQANAYYGLALALDDLGDRPGATGAMRTFVHLSLPENPFLPRARAALWQWDSDAGAARTSGATIPNNGKMAGGAPNGGKNAP